MTDLLSNTNIMTYLSIILGLFLSGFAQAAGQWFFKEHAQQHAEKAVNTLKNLPQAKIKTNGSTIEIDIPEHKKKVN